MFPWLLRGGFGIGAHGRQRATRETDPSTTPWQIDDAAAAGPQLIGSVAYSRAGWRLTLDIVGDLAVRVSDAEVEIGVLVTLGAAFQL